MANSRVLLELVIEEFQDGATPEAIVQQYSTLSLSEVYSVIAYYLRHREEVQAYLDQRQNLAQRVRKQIEDTQGDMNDIRSRLLTRTRA